MVPTTRELTRRHEMVLAAAVATRSYIVRTPLLLSRAHTERLGFPVYLKLENLQVTGAFKARGAMNAVLALKEAGVGRVVAPSSGSHAMGVALAARVTGLEATVVMPETSPPLKRDRVRSYGARVVVQGRTFEDAYEASIEIAGRTEAVLISGINDEMVMAGQGTMALEIIEDLPGVDLLGVPVGGGGALAGVLTALRSGGRSAAGRPPALEVWGVQASEAPSMKVSLERGMVTRIPAARTVADAIAVREPGEAAFRLVAALADGVTTVDDEAIMEAVVRLALGDKVVAEPAAAAPLAVDWERVIGRKPRAAVFIVTGGNIDRRLLADALGRDGG